MGMVAEEVMAYSFAGLGAKSSGVLQSISHNINGYALGVQLAYFVHKHAACGAPRVLMACRASTRDRGGIVCREVASVMLHRGENAQPVLRKEVQRQIKLDVHMISAIVQIIIRPLPDPLPFVRERGCPRSQ